MDLFLDYPLTTLFILAVAVLVLVRMAKRSPRPAGKRLCARCRLTLPHEAKFCSACGQALPPDSA